MSTFLYKSSLSPCLPPFFHLPPSLLIIFYLCIHLPPSIQPPKKILLLFISLCSISCSSKLVFFQTSLHFHCFSRQRERKLLFYSFSLLPTPLLFFNSSSCYDDDPIYFQMNVHLVFSLNPFVVHCHLSLLFPLSVFHLKRKET